ncbi:MAG TPA: energy transducer TonB [Chakrabartia sp.]|jgi:TonB family protein|nr:energy transducer TonB [Chakrabartia sp.]
MLRFGLALTLLMPTFAHAQGAAPGQLGKTWYDKRGYTQLAQIGVNLDEPSTLDPDIFRDVMFDWRISKTNVGLYPPAAYARRQTGVVGVTLSITDAGLISTCTMNKSSGFPALDAHACPHLMAKARFVPRMNKDGRNVPTAINASIDYSLVLMMQTLASGPQPEQPLRAQPLAEITFATLGITKDTPKPKDVSYLRYRLAVNEQGVPTACRAQELTGSNAIDKQMCDGLLANARFKPAKRKDGTAVASEYWGGTYWP